MTFIKIIVALAVIACVASILSCCKAAGRADEDMERMIREKEKSNE